jgi:hypothetical protein
VFWQLPERVLPRTPAHRVLSLRTPHYTLHTTHHTLHRLRTCHECLLDRDLTPKLQPLNLISHKVFVKSF